MKHNFSKSVFLVVLLLVFSGLCPIYGASQNQDSKLLSQPEIQQKIQQVKDKQNLAEDLKNRVLAIYFETEDNLNEAKDQEILAEDYKRSLSALPVQAKQLARQINEADASLKNRKPEKLMIFPTDELEQRLIIEKTKLSDLEAEMNLLEGQIGDQLSRPQLIREKISELKSQQISTQQELQGLAGKTIENSLEKEALQLRLDSRIRLLNSSLKALELENISDPLRLQAKKDQVHFLSLQHEQLGMLIADLENLLLDRRQQEIDKEQADLQEAEKAAEGKHPLIQTATRENMHYNQLLLNVTKNMEQFLVQKNELEQRYKQLDKDFQTAEQKINLAGLSPALGNLLREQRRNLPQHKEYTSLNDTIQNYIAQTSLESFKLEEAKKSLTDIGQALLTRMDQQLSADLSDGDKLRIRTELRMLLSDQKELVSRLATVYTEYARVLGDVDFNLQQMLATADKFSAYLDQRLLWVPSAPVIDKYYFKEILKSAWWFISPGNWQQVIVNFWHALGNNPFLLVLGLLIPGLHWRYNDILKNRVGVLLSRGASIGPHLHGFGHTLEALAYVLILSFSTPMLMAWAGGVLILGGSTDFFSHAIAVGLFSAALSLAILQFFFRLFKPQGVADILFQWPPQISALLFSQFKWSRFVFVPCIFVTAMTGSDAFSEHSLALGRMASIVMMLAMAYMFHRFTHPTKGLGKSFYLQSQTWGKWLPYLAYALALSIPLLIIGFAVAGYYQSALELQAKLVFTLRLLFITVLFHELAQDWLAVTQRQLALRNAKQKRKQGEAVASAEVGFAVEEVILDISKIDRQSHKLLSTVIAVMVLLGCWMIWREILPAFFVLDQIQLWQHSEMLDGKEILQPITLTNLLVSLAYAMLGFVFVSNFPALVDLLSVGKYEMSAGSRYALIQLSRYLLTTIAFLSIANQLGGSWSQVQWLVAALSVGLGFGLQEIFANMVSGIILLFERPIRVGDTVTVGEVTGRVSRIQMRATHIVDWDRKELVVPNKIFITDRLINWTLSDTVTRIVVPVGVAYGSEIGLVEAILREAITKTPLVLKEPSPNVLFNGFGDSSLMFNIHVFVHELTDRLAVNHSLHKNIYEAFQANKIEMPFPQQDVHIRSVINHL